MRWVLRNHHLNGTSSVRSYKLDLNTNCGIFDKMTQNGTPIDGIDDRIKEVRNVPENN